LSIATIIIDLTGGKPVQMSMQGSFNTVIRSFGNAVSYFPYLNIVLTQVSLKWWHSHNILIACVHTREDNAVDS